MRSTCAVFSALSSFSPVALTALLVLGMAERAASTASLGVSQRRASSCPTTAASWTRCTLAAASFLLLWCASSFVGSLHLPLHLAPAVDHVMLLSWQGKAELARTPLIGTLFRATDPILVPRSQRERERLPNVVVAIKRRVTAEPRHAPLIIFPYDASIMSVRMCVGLCDRPLPHACCSEGTTVSQRSLIRFQRGAFIPGVPVMPVLVSYPYRNLDLSWTNDVHSLWLLYRALCQVLCVDAACSRRVSQPRRRNAWTACVRDGVTVGVNTCRCTIAST